MSGTHASKQTRRFRGDVEGLRAVAVGLVLLYHAGLPLVPGGFVGVDVFFVISGFLITGLLLKELERTGRISLSGFYARRAKRLLPAVAVVLGATALMVLAWVPKIRWSEIGGDLVASSLYVVNWRLADRSVDYLAEDSEPSPVQHFWSLAVEEQYYLIWPLLMIAVTWWARRRGRPLGRSLSLGVLVVGVPSLIWSVYYTSSEPASAFFVSTTRLWELAIGAGVAIAARQLSRLPSAAAIVMGWAGVASIVASALVFSVETAWPGYNAAVPTLGTAAVIAAGLSAGRFGPALILATPLFRWVGGLSYSLYLWHWPLIIVATAYWDGLSVKRGLAVAAFSVIPAWLTHKLVENPFRFSAAISRAPRLALSLGANFTLAGVVAGFALMLAVPQAPTPVANAEGAGVLNDSNSGTANPGKPVDSVSPITPDPLEATKDVPDLYGDGCQQRVASSEVLACEYGDPNGDTTITLVGDSKIAQWLPAFQALAQDRHWRIVTMTKSACPFAAATVSMDGEPYESCREWVDNAVAKLLDDPPDVVVTTQNSKYGTSDDGQRGTDGMMVGLHQVWGTLNDAGIDVVALSDSPGGKKIYACVAENRDTLTRCAFDRGPALERTSTALLAEAVDTMPDSSGNEFTASGSGGVSMIDLNNEICPTEKCAPVIGNVLVYRQGTHITATYIETLAPALERELDATGLLPGDESS